MELVGLDKEKKETSKEKELSKQELEKKYQESIKAAREAVKPEEGDDIHIQYSKIVQDITLDLIEKVSLTGRRVHQNDVIGIQADVMGSIDKALLFHMIEQSGIENLRDAIDVKKIKSNFTIGDQS